MFDSCCRQLFVHFQKIQHKVCFSKNKKLYLQTNSESRYNRFNRKSNVIKMQKCNFFKTNLVSKDIFILRKNAVIRPKLKKYYKLFYKFFSKLPFNKTLHQKSGKFMARLLIYFFLTHDLFFFLKKLVNFLKNTPRKYQLKIVRFFKLINQHYFRNAFIYFGVSGLYFSVSGKFGGVGGSKKLKKKLV